MKKLIFMILCMLLISSAAMAAGYQASGKIYDASTTTLAPVTGATGSISNGSSTNSITTSTQNNGWSGGWSQGSMAGNKMRATAQKTSLGLYGSKSWDASSTNVDKNIDILLKSGIALNPGLGIDMEAVAFTNPGLQSAVNASLINTTGFPVEVYGFTAQVAYDLNKITLPSTNPLDYAVDSFFDISAVDISVPGKIVLTGVTPGLQVIPNETSIEIFKLPFEVLPFTSRDLTIVDVNVNIDEGTPMDDDAVPHQTVFLLGSTEHSDPYFLIEDEDEWLANLDVNILPMLPIEFDAYLLQWQEPEFLQFPGLPYPSDPFLPPELYVYEGDGVPGGEPNDAGLVMRWGEESTQDGNYTAAWKYDYRLDPDFTNCIITVTVTAPQFSPTPPHNQVNIVSLGLQNVPQVGGPVRAWYWNCGPGTGIPWNTPVTITIDTSKTGVAAATPTATNHVLNPGFNITTVQWILVDENANWVGSPVIAPPPGGSGIAGAWNYWHNLSVTAKAGGGGSNAVNSKWFVKYSQPPVSLDANAQPPTINGWDQLSNYTNGPIMADDWKCEDERPVTDIHWWGSFIGWNSATPPPVMPQQFHIGIWTDVATNDPCNTLGYSHPGMLVWENFCDSFVWNYAGVDVDPRPNPVEDEACFQFAQFLSEDEWFHQHPMDDGTPNVYWLSIAPIWTAQEMADPDFREWGWKTRPHIYNDDGCSIISVDSGNWPINIFDVWASGDELKGPVVNETDSWDLAFELTTNEPVYTDNPIPGDFADDSGGPPDGDVDVFDLAIFASQWLEGVTTP